MDSNQKASLERSSLQALHEFGAHRAAELLRIHREILQADLQARSPSNRASIEQKYRPEPLVVGGFDFLIGGGVVEGAA